MKNKKYHTHSLFGLTSILKKHVLIGSPFIHVFVNFNRLVSFCYTLVPFVVDNRLIEVS